MKPSTKLRAVLPMSMTAAALASAIETTNFCPFGEMDTELGVAVSGASGKRLTEIVSVGSPDAVSKAQTAELLAQATNRRRPSADSTSALGCSPVVHSEASVRSAVL